jgi:hypothetical protein
VAKLGDAKYCMETVSNLSYFFHNNQRTTDLPQFVACIWGTNELLSIAMKGGKHDEAHYNAFFLPNVCAFFDTLIPHLVSKVTWDDKVPELLQRKGINGEWVSELCVIIAAPLTCVALGRSVPPLQHICPCPRGCTQLSGSKQN